MLYDAETAWETAVSHAYVLNETLRILVVDDDPIQREFAKVYLSTPTVDVETACNGAEGLARLEDENFDIALVDIDMPVMNGFELVEAVRDRPSLHELPIIVITGREDIESIDRAFALGATSFVCKAVNWRLLSYQIKFVLRAGRAVMQPA